MPSPFTRCFNFIRANGGFLSVIGLAVRKLHERGPLYTLRAVSSNLSPVPRFPQRRYRHYITRHERTHHAALAADAASAPTKTVLLIACQARGTAAAINTESLTAQGWRVLPLAAPATAAALNAALRDATADYAAILWPGDRLAADAADLVSRAIARETVIGEQLSVISEVKTHAPPHHRPPIIDPCLPTTDHRLPITAHFPTLIYSDEDRLDAHGRRHQPHFKPDWSPDTLLDWPYIGNLCLFDRQAALACGGFCAAFTTADALLYDLVLRLTEHEPCVRHIPAVLYHAGSAHLKTGQAAAVLGSAELTEARRRAVARRGMTAIFEDAPTETAWASIRPDLGFAPLLALPRLRLLPLAVEAAGDAGSGFRVQGLGEPLTHSNQQAMSNLPSSLSGTLLNTCLQPGPPSQNSSFILHPSSFSPPLVSIIIPTRNHVADLATCISSILARTTYRHLEILVVDNGSDEPETLRYLERIAAGLRTRTGTDVPVRVMRLDIPFNFSILNNRAAQAATGTFLLFLNNDTEVVTPDWIERMLGHAIKPWTGAIGATLLYPDGTIQHAGVATVGLGPTHICGHLPADYPHPRCQRDGNWSAVTAACMLLSAEKFHAVGGFDESLAIAFNDVDLCYRLLDQGWPAVLTSQARLIHHEFKTRGHDRASVAKRARMLAELDRLFGRWPALRHDPFYNPALSVSYPDLLPRG